MTPVSIVAVQLAPDSFLAGQRLWFLLAVAALAAVYVVVQFRRRSYALRFTNVELFDKVAPSRPGWRRHVPPTLFLLALVGLIVGFARPTQDTQVPRERATIMLAIDTSLSMEATDVDPNRLAGAQQAASRFVAGLPETINVGLVAFNGVATVRVSPTTNHDAVVASIESLELGPATAIGEAIFASLGTLDELGDETGEAPPARIVVMSDGETTVGRPDEEAVAAAQQAGIAVSTIAFGTDDGIIILPDESVPVAVPVNEEKLAQIADATGGEFFTAATTDQLDRVYDDIGSSFSFETIRDEISSSWVGLGLAFLGLTAVFSLLWFSRLP